MPDNDLFLYIFFSGIAVLGIGLIIFISSRNHHKLEKKVKKKKTKVRKSGELSKDRLSFEIKGKAKYFIETNTKNSFLTISVTIINKGTETLMIRDIEVLMSNRIGKLEKEKAMKTIPLKDKKKFIVGDKITFPLALTPNITNNMSLTFMFTATSIVVGKFNIKLFTSLGELAFPITVEIEK